ncbi:hypothetical protein K437DRAFT_256136 [Tilletiaria anomala UBC 951]|uniref:Prenylcysteine lyase domain-containing protein n=1 Tax=Tilletiaria anomala (strain ATCC 24038 / CBS 436.72 / UBC 951) TaxID=1037660 RepID=A0A066W6B4_TILAU|nr:uncharacterized protein K437DRAFT_256136 [Tilletiaria anomala UBC 951]KDN46629.1 hypothetical protein K437DRAFT_256136 [Tilletiaria anomala UBC 951]
MRILLCLAFTVLATGLACARDDGHQQQHQGIRVLDGPVPEFAARFIEHLDVDARPFTRGDNAESATNQLPWSADATPLYLEQSADERLGGDGTESDNAAARLASLCPPSGKRTRKIAVVGAGPSGSSAAFFLGQAQEKLRKDKKWRKRQEKEECEEELEIVVFEKEERVGGRATVVHPYDDPENYPAVELGASIFANVNRNMVRAAKRFNLPTSAHLGEEHGATSVWDGQQFVFENLDDGWWNSAKMLWRYGYSPMTTKNLVKDLTERFLNLYNAAWMHSTGVSKPKFSFPWRSIEEFAASLNFSELAAVSTLDHFYHETRISKLFVEEIVEAATRVNYGQNTDELHALGGGVSLAASGAAGVNGGNYQIFERMLDESGSKLRLGSHGRVTGIIKYKNVEDAVASGKVSAAAAMEQHWLEGSTKYYVGTVSNFGELYDAVFIAAPWQNAGITLLGADAHFPPIEYVHLHVTLAVTNTSSPRPEYFGRGQDEVMPKTVLTSKVSVRKDERKQGAKQDSLETILMNKSSVRKNDGKHYIEANSHPRLEFNSLNYIRKLPPRKARDGSFGAEEHLVKIFSADEISDEKLDELLGAGTVSWVLRKTWDAYPRLKPTREFPPLVADERLYYINALEPLISTMETSTISARNSAALLLQEWYGDEFIHGGTNCPNLTEADEGEIDQGDDDWAGWGCRSA